MVFEFNCDERDQFHSLVFSYSCAFRAICCQKGCRWIGLNLVTAFEMHISVIRGRLGEILRLVLTASHKDVSFFVGIPSRLEMVLMTLRKLRIKKQFKPCPVNSEDEIFPNGIFIFNISKMTEFINANQPLFPKELISIKDLDNWNKGILNEETINCADLSRPIILAEISPGRLSWTS